MPNTRDYILIREKEIIKLIESIKKLGLKYIIVGGYAVATIMKRFSVDLDIVIKDNEKEKFEEMLKKEGYSIAYSKEISTLYKENFIRFEKTISSLPVSADFLINGLVSRTTNASWSFEYIKENSEIRNLEELSIMVPKKELLIAMKLHSGRISDIRDIVALSKDSSIDLVLKHSKRGDIEKLKKNISNSLEYIKSKNFRDSFQGVFGIHSHAEELAKNCEEMLKALINS